MSHDTLPGAAPAPPTDDPTAQSVLATVRRLQHEAEAARAAGDTEDVARLHAVIDRLSELVEDLALALRSRDVIGQAKGILMSSRHVSEDVAVDLLLRASREENTGLRVVAARVARDGDLTS